jgi:hypothetical protein
MEIASFSDIWNRGQQQSRLRSTRLFAALRPHIKIKGRHEWNILPAGIPSGVLF